MERRRIRFLFRCGMRVAWTAHPGVPFVVWHKRYTARAGLWPVIEYGLAPETLDPPPLLAWAYEKDVQCWEDPQ